MAKIRRMWLVLLATLILLLTFTGCGQGTKTGDKQQTPLAAGPVNKNLILATTTSTMDSGLLDVLIPMFEEKSGYIVKPNAVGTGQALAMGDQGNADVLLVHAPADEVKLVQKGTVINRQLVMHNDFIIVGPPSDPAGIRGVKKAADAFKKIAAKQAIFVSRGDDSGTHKKEKDIWKEAGINPQGKWYQEAGAGMGQTLNIASEKGGYTLTDRGTYLALKKNLNLDIMLEGEKTLLNIYHVMQVNPEKFPGMKINSEGAKAFVDFMVAPETQKVIGDFGKDKFGQSLFFPDAGKDENTLGQ
ncbi:tungsten ABC transporter substrate-binding protein [Moorella thermoacetica]|uniref:Extracellular solute-binding protein, family 1 n=1 Tax=Moorella thermoacetica (strain ATCC 39073 / JCM 9320) TaxID=264732 RepID=Q2RMD3_MOOTA|nr:substrate-binding domain-containing protein [Moorella thermoacetica]AKX92896.1 PBP superfamily domain protein [Moorella thermoacetica]AKX95449.1 PBP superfamily domain protein [Moorella thermoacetica]OIQ56905.1 PBP superfamily domain protein [Moorella thermoacetica]QCZ99257.1 PBP superfamily domain protein [Moorella thermoacetica]TYL09093.1 Tungstate-binding protein TupA [Moorella thermoacetica]